MGSFYKDKERAEQSIRLVLVRAGEPLDLKTVTIAVKASSGLQVGERIVEGILDVLIYKKEVVNNSGLYSWNRGGTQ